MAAIGCVQIDMEFRSLRSQECVLFRDDFESIIGPRSS